MNSEEKYTLVDSKTGKPVDELNDKEKKELELRLIRGWNWCTDSEDIMKILHLWIGAGRNEDMSVGQPFFIISSTNRTRIVTFWEDGEGNAALNKGEQDNYFDTPFDEKSNSNRRGAVLEAFARIEFLLDHLALISCGVYTDVGNPKYTLRTIRAQNTHSKIAGLKRMPELSGVSFNAIERMRTLRNQMAHQYSVEHIEYHGISLSRGNGSGHQITQSLNTDYNEIITSIFQAYYDCQTPVVEWPKHHLESAS